MRTITKIKIRIRKANQILGRQTFVLDRAWLLLLFISMVAVAENALEPLCFMAEMLSMPCPER